MMSLIKRLIPASLILGLTIFGASAVLPVAPAQASEIKYVVNDVAITSYDIQKRAAFLKLQRRAGASASEDMIEQTLRDVELKRLNVDIPEKSVDDAYARFAQTNKLTIQQLDQIMEQSGVTKSHFRDYIRVQMGWSQALRARYRATGALSDQDVVRRMLKEGGEKPSATEYMLQQVIFVVPAAERGNLGKRKREAEAMRQRFSGCETTQEFAKGLLDVSVKDLGRVLAPELPPDWADHIKATQPGSATPVRETDRGVEFIGVCSAREVSDDRVAKMVFQSEDAPDDAGEELNKKYLAELREKALIVER